MGVVSGLTRLVGDKKTQGRQIRSVYRHGTATWDCEFISCLYVCPSSRCGRPTAPKSPQLVEAQRSRECPDSSKRRRRLCLSRVSVLIRRCQEGAALHVCWSPSRNQRDGCLTIVTQLCLSRVSLSPSRDQESHSRYVRIRHEAAALSFHSVSAMQGTPAALGVC